MRLAYAVVRDNPPDVHAAENLDVLHRVLALHVVAATPASSLPDGVPATIRAALLDERWADAVTEWMQYSKLAVDVYDDLRVWTDADVDRDLIGVELQFAPLFLDEV
jgi:hypothetical protein